MKFRKLYPNCFAFCLIIISIADPGEGRGDLDFFFIGSGTGSRSWPEIIQESLFFTFLNNKHTFLELSTGTAKNVT
jgi:hypothetical protein